MKKKLLVLGIFLCISFFCVQNFRYKMQINELKNQISIYKQIVPENNKALEFLKNSGEGYDYLAIGNSITLHPITDFWWSEDGMAASNPNNDYFHLLCNRLDCKYGSINCMSYNYSAWEIQYYDRAETYYLLDQYLNENLELITVQLSENCHDMTTFEEDFEALLLHIKQKCPEATVLVVDEFWDEQKHEIKEEVCKKLDIEFIDLSDIRMDPSYQAELGNVVMGDDGQEHVIDHEGVARHPNDNAMKEISDRIYMEIND